MTATILIHPVPHTHRVSFNRVRFDHVACNVSAFYEYQRTLCTKMGNADERLGHLFFAIASLEPHCRLSLYGSRAQKENALAALVHHLSVVAAFGIAWLSADDFEVAVALDRVFAERERQRRLLREGKILFACESRIVDVRRKFRVLAEEIGEVADAIDKLESAGKHGMAEAIHHLETEIVQVVAVAMAWLESFQSAECGIPGTEVRDENHSALRTPHSALERSRGAVAARRAGRPAARVHLCRLLRAGGLHPRPGRVGGVVRGGPVDDLHFSQARTPSRHRRSLRPRPARPHAPRARLVNSQADSRACVDQGFL